MNEELTRILETSGDELKNRRIGLCITGSPASMRSPEIARALIRSGAEVFPILSDDAKNFIQPQLMEWATQNKVLITLDGLMDHIKFVEGSEKLDLLLISPATANTLSKIALGISDTIVTIFTSSSLGAGIPIIIAPSMHESLWMNPILKSHVKSLEKLGICVIKPIVVEGKAKLPSTEVIVESVIQNLSEKDMIGQKVLVTAGPTIEHIDPVRIITNKGSGKMGFSLAKEALRRGAKVTLISGPTSINPPPDVEFYGIETTKQLFDTVISKLESKNYTLFVSAGSPEDFYPLNPSEKKISSRQGSINLEFGSSEKVINHVKRIKPDVSLISFRAVWGLTRNEAIESGRELMHESDSDLVAVNDLALKGSGFQYETNKIILLLKSGSIIDIPLDHKQVVSKKIFDIYLNIPKKGAVKSTRIHNKKK
jgi:phosphopantothenoylcysteine decarboxylase/phosphopantothenate--cysteine ligase